MYVSLFTYTTEENALYFSVRIAITPRYPFALTLESRTLTLLSEIKGILSI